MDSAWALIMVIFRFSLNLLISCRWLFVLLWMNHITECSCSQQKHLPAKAFQPPTRWLRLLQIQGKEMMIPTVIAVHFHMLRVCWHQNNVVWDFFFFHHLCNLKCERTDVSIHPDKKQTYMLKNAVSSIFVAHVQSIQDTWNKLKWNHF